eukprot:CAMPEP_0201549892 /NCGR_PEP_ID=MMETSP0173_2-20130828/6314_1 /ASSEMBLY_ACC=CAM_ASM_000268 /TAXON_ID=218659 /ORGANISM="Vexillifera sp., Strain DIVA3 564/2" /LENGTH=568 /DNA_ID=CAMNT_0047959725 /DNA_START=83 /DNA_END=1789 /DNA_ORIENTATION=+
MNFKIFALTLLLLIAVVTADQYMHNPRGSNNRLNERTANRNNGNRMFDSQNNNKGGYNVGDLTDEPFTTEAQQGRIKYYAGSLLDIEWTNQHACGSNEKVRCEHIIQYMCGNVRNGVTTNTPPENADDTSTGLHEPRAYYSACKNDIERNRGLFTADQNLQGDTAIYTRQNPNGNRNGYECPEERDYYPWWHPNPWKDIAILTSAHSEIATDLDDPMPTTDEDRNNTADPTYGVEGTAAHIESRTSDSSYRPELYGPRGLGKLDRCGDYEKLLSALGRPMPDCQPAIWSRDNHLGNTLDGYMAKYKWEIPSPQEACGQDTCSCVLRTRYNMSSTDYSWWTNSSYNGGEEKSPVEQNPTVGIGIMQGFRLAINTAQVGRTFQDRSHVFEIHTRPAALGNAPIHNLNVRGKRGNIVQTYPAVEYDFHPNNLEIEKGHWVHLQWTGSNTHNNNAPAGDGQAGDDGQGTGGTDRSNFVEIRSLDENYPVPFKHNTIWNNIVDSFPKKDPEQMALDFATVGEGTGVNSLLNDAPATYNAGLFKLNPGTYHYMCTRNNNFSNRSQKGTITVKDN